MRPQEFLYGVRDRAAVALPPELRDFRSKAVYATLQLHWLSALLGEGTSTGEYQEASSRGSR